MGQICQCALKKTLDFATFLRKDVRDGASQRKKLSETVQVKEKRRQRRCKSKKKAVRDGASQRKKTSETVQVKEKTCQRRCKSKKKAVRDGASHRKKVSEMVF